MGKRAGCAAGSRRSRRGETLTETLITMLIIGLSSVLLLTMVGASGRIFRKAKEEYKSVYEDKIAFADVQSTKCTESDTMGDVTVKGESDMTGVPVDVDWYGDKDGKKDYVISYRVP